MPAYEDLVAALDALGDDSSTPAAPRLDADGLDTARDGWRDVGRRVAAHAGRRASARRWSAGSWPTSASWPGPTRSRTLLAGTDPSTPPALGAAGAGVQGIAALEVAPVRRRRRRPGHAGRRRAAASTPPSVTAIAREAVREVLADWTGGYRDTFVAGMDGDPQASVDAIVNEVIFRLTEIDDHGLRALAEAASPDELPDQPADGPAAFHLAELPRRSAAWSASSVQRPTDGRRAARARRARSADTARPPRGAAAAARRRPWPTCPTR